MVEDRIHAPDRLERIDAHLAHAEGVALIGVVSIMVALAALQLVLRKLFDVGFEWADIVVRQMVLWLGFLGGSLATHEGRHIAIDAVSRFLHARHAATARAITSAGAVLVSMLLVYASSKFLGDEVESGAKAFGEVPAWPFEAIIPLAFAAIAFHFFVGARRDLLVALGRRSPLSERSAGDPASDRGAAPDERGGGGIE